MTANTIEPQMKHVTLSSAILLYSNKDGNRYATVHPITSDKAGRSLLGAGRPVCRETLLTAMRELDRNATPKAEFLPAKVLGVVSGAVTWWCPPTMRRVFFKCQEIGNRSAIVPHPGLVFQAAKNAFRVFAVKSQVRPERDTPLFEPPYFNTWNGGQICIGTANVPREMSVSSIDGWEAGFFDSAFTHPNQGSKRVQYEMGGFGFWRDMLDGKFGEVFPEDVLVATPWTTETLVKGAIKEAM